MPACIPYSEEEMIQMVESYSFGTGDRLRNQAVFSLECATGARINEILKLNRGDVMDRLGRLKKVIAFTNTKNKSTITADLVNPFAKFFLKKWLLRMEEEGYTGFRTYLFPSPVLRYRAISYRQVLNIYDKAHIELRLEGQHGTHSCRKTWAIETYWYYDRLRKAGESIDPLMKLFATGRWKTMDAMQKYLMPLMGETRESQEGIYKQLQNKYGG